MKLSLGRADLDLRRPVVMGVLNVTPDSFSDGGQYFDFDVALRHACSMHAEGASIIDVGGESTRPGAKEVSAAEELDRILPVIEAIHRDLDVFISVDTSKPTVMAAAVEAGASLINDVYALRQDGALEMAAKLDAAVCLMHMQGEPRTMQARPHYDDVTGEIMEYLSAAVVRCREAGIAANRLLIDPGFGFGKSDAHNFELLANLQRITELDLPLLVGLSRKRSLGNLTGRSEGERQAAGLAAAVLAAERGANVIRTHDVAATVDAVKVMEAVRSMEQTT
jgi:dihydropteroate synthase